MQNPSLKNRLRELSKATYSRASTVTIEWLKGQKMTEENRHDRD